VRSIYKKDAKKNHQDSAPLPLAPTIATFVPGSRKTFQILLAKEKSIDY